ncbi:hypothetical protein TspCOW1_29820 [Thiohalobacter sp. COW1]|nr:hypothetical protein TspCOW1_29820 [Thiohalobacter sp. COW1]
MDLTPYLNRRPGTYRTACPVCDRGPRDTAAAVTVEPEGGAVWFCHRCGSTGSSRGQERHQAPPPPRNIEPPREGLDEWAARIWSETQPITGNSTAGRYLQARCCELPPMDADLRWHPDLWHPAEKKAAPALVALVTDTLNGKPLSLHRTWISPAGNKIFDPPRLLARGHKTAGGAIRLWPDEAVTHGLALAEGIETALSVASVHRPIWAAIDAGHLAAFPVLEGIEALTLYADRDPHGKGEQAARACARRWAAAGREAAVALPPRSGDWNDVAREAA